MAYPNVAVPQYPDIPFVAGVPNALRNPNQAQTYALSGGIAGLPIVLSSLITANGQLSPTNPQTLPLTPATYWGIYNSEGEPIALADSIVEVEFRGERKLSDYPQEAGSFASYNKVGVPYAARIRMAKGGDLTGRQQFVTTLDGLLGGLDLYSIITPEITYQNANIVHYDYHRTARNGATMLLVDVWVEEVRLTGNATLSGLNFALASAQASGASPSSTGPVLPVTPSVAQATQIGTPAAPGSTGNWITQTGAFPSQ
jgi:hypothetical protein